VFNYVFRGFFEVFSVGVLRVSCYFGFLTVFGCMNI